MQPKEEVKVLRKPLTEQQRKERNARRNQKRKQQKVIFGQVNKYRDDYVLEHNEYPGYETAKKFDLPYNQAQVYPGFWKDFYAEYGKKKLQQEQITINTPSEALIYLADDKESRQTRKDNRQTARQDRRQARADKGSVGTTITGVADAITSILPADSGIGPADPYSSQSVSTDHIAQVIAPEVSSSREPTGFLNRTAIAHASQTYPVTTDANGAAGMYIFPDNPTYFVSPTVEFGQAFIVNLDGFVASTGDFSTFTGVAGPLKNMLDSIVNIKCNAFSVSFLPTVSDLNNQGEVHFIYWQKPFLDNMVTSTEFTIPFDQLALAPYYVRSNMKGVTNKRMIKVPATSIDAGYHKAETVNQPPFNQGYYLVFTGCIASQVIGELKINYTYEYEPQIDAMPLLDVQEPPPGFMTSNAISNIFKQFKEIQSLDLSEAVSLANEIKDSTPYHDNIISSVRSWFKTR